MGEYFSKSFFDFVFEPIGHYASFRPLGQLTSAALFELSGRSLILIQLFNFILTISAVWFILRGVAEKKGFSIAFLITGGILFAAFAYLFHLHGLYYSPVLLLIAVLIYYYFQPLSVKNIIIIFISAITAALFHPFSIFIYLFYSAGLLFEKKNELKSKSIVYLSGSMALLIILSFILVPNQTIFLSGTNIYGLMKIYRSLQINPMISLIIFGTALFTIQGVPVSKKGKFTLFLTLVIISVFIYILKLPLLLAVFIAGIIKLIYIRKWTILALLTVTFIFSVFTDVESGHLKFLVLFIIAFSVSINTTLPRAVSVFRPAYGVLLILVTSFFVILLRNDVNIPGISKYTVSLLATRESSYNLENVIKWYINSNYSDYEVELDGNKSKFPASVENIQTYLSAIRGKTKFHSDKKLIISFNKEKPQKFFPLYTIRSEYAENVYVYLRNF
jgi:hypothetical protein